LVTSPFYLLIELPIRVQLIKVVTEDGKTEIVHIDIVAHRGNDGDGVNARVVIAWGKGALSCRTHEED
jgi:hypothetical protein